MRGHISWVGAVLVAGALLARPALAQMYKWTDANGVTHFSDAAPAGVPAASVKTVKPAITSTPVDPTDWKAKETAFQQRQAKKYDEDQRNEAAAEKESARKHAECLRNQRDASILKRGAPVYTTDEKGNKNYLDDAQRAQALARDNAQISQNCSE